MTGLIYSIVVHLHGALSADAKGVIRIPLQGATLVEVAACGSNANTGKLTVGTSADADGYLKAGDIGDESAPAVFNAANFDGALADALKLSAPHLAKNAVLTWSLAVGATPPADVDLQFSFLEG